MKYVSIYTILISFLLPDIKDSIHLKLKDLSTYKKKYNVNIMPVNDPDKIKSETHLFEGQLNEIRLQAKNYIIEPATKTDVVIMETTRGTMKLKLFPDIAPNHCNNFKKLANSGFYDETGFHRVIPGFMIQGGDLNTRDGDPKNDGRGGPGWTVDAEFSDLPHKRGTLSMARSTDPNSAGSQFFICDAYAQHLNGKYTVFGEVIENFSVIDKIVNSTTEYSNAKRNCLTEIPKNSIDTWVTLKDPKGRALLYSKVPEGRNKVEFQREMQSLLSSDRPLALPKIKKVRVVKGTE